MVYRVVVCPKETMWIKATDLRVQVQSLLSYTKEQMGHTQWIGHILNRLQLADRHRRKAYAGGQMYRIKREELLDMMHRYDVNVIAQ